MTQPVPCRLRLYRKARGLTQEDVARQVGVSRQTLAGIEKGTVSPTLDTMLKIAALLGVGVLAIWLLSELGKGGEKRGQPN